MSRPRGKAPAPRRAARKPPPAARPRMAPAGSRWRDAPAVKSLLEIAPRWYYWEQDEHYRFTRLAGSVLEQAGLELSSYLGKTRWELGSVPMGDDGDWEPHKAVLDARRPFADFVFKYVAGLGEVRYVSASGQPQFDARGRFRGYRGLARDVTHRIRAERRLAIEHGVSRILAEAGSIAEAAPLLIRLICERLRWACGAYWDLHAPTQELHCMYTWGVASPDVDQFLAASKGLSASAGQTGGVIRRACSTGEPVWIEDVSQDPTFLRAENARQAALRSGFAFPVKTGAEVIGAMEFFGREADRLDRELLEAARHVGGSIGQFRRRKRAEEELRRLSTAMDASPDLFYIVDPVALRFLYVNETACRMAGYTHEEHLQVRPWQVQEIDQERLQEIYAEVIRKGDEGVTTEARAHARDGRRGIFETHRRALRTEDDRWVIVSVSRDISLRRRAERSALRLGRMYAALGATNEAILRAKSPEELYQKVCEGAVEGGLFVTAALLVPDTQTGWAQVVAVAGGGARRLRAAPISVDAATPEGLGLVGTAFRTRRSSVSNDFLQDERTRPWHEQAKKGGVNAAAAVPLLAGDRALGILLLYSEAKRTFDDDVVKLLERMAQDIVFGLENFEREAERERAEQRIQYLATHDGLTGLPNRVMFSEVLNVAIEVARRYQRGFAVVFIDLDRFKVINDSLGHGAGDVLLKEMARRIKECLRASDVVARLGGDEFVLLVQEVLERGQVVPVARKILSAAMKPLEILGQECRVTASIGIAMFPGDADDEESLMKHADLAMYLAKEDGKNNFQFYSNEAKAQSIERLTLETNLRRALDREEFSLHYQAKVDFASGAITGVEALLRWQNPEVGSISPAHFIPLCEEIGLIVPLGKWVLRTACAQNMAWEREGLPPVCMAVNLSARQFADDRLLGDIDAILRETGMPPERLELEITEGMVIHNPERALRVLTAIKQMGIRLAIDDFGTGYSSLGQLKHFPIDTLKVDRSFIREIATDPEDKAITQAIIAMGKTLSLTVVAEGVETEEQARFLRDHACDEMQGYLFSRPVTADRFAELLRKNMVTR